MRFNDHSSIEGQHAFLSPSYYHWVNYDDDKLVERWTRRKASDLGSRLHAYAKNAIELGIRQSKSRTTLNMYINDAISYKMTPEQVLYFSENSFGTADAISFRKDLLRIHDLKTGVIKASVHQLEVYAALFCLEYGLSPFDITMEFRIYQNDEIDIYEGDPQVIWEIMEKIIYFDNRIAQLKEGGL